VLELIEACIGPHADDVPIETTGRAVEGFAWPPSLERTSIFAWVRLLDRLDEFLTYVTESNIKVLLDPEGPGSGLEAELRVGDDEVISALDCSLEVLRHVAGKEYYNSLPQLCDLLASSNPIIVNKTLLLLQCVYERNVSGLQVVPTDLANRLQTIAVPPCGPGLMDVAKRDVSAAKEKGGVHFKFSIEPNPAEHVDERTEEEKLFGSTEPKVVKFDSRSELPDDDFEALGVVMESHGPVRGRRQRFRLLRSIRASAVYEYSPDQLELEARNRLLATAVLVPVGLFGEVYGRVNETFRKLGADDLLTEIFAEDSALTEETILCGLQAFTAKFVGSERSSYKLDGLDRLLQDGRYSPLGRFLATRCTRESMDSELRVKIVQEAISMVNSLCNQSYLCDELLETEVLECVVPFVSDADPAVRGVCEKALSTIEILLTNSTAGANRLDACSGFDAVQDRLQAEVTAALTPSTSGTSTSTSPSSSLRSLSYDDRLLIKKLLQVLTKIVITSEVSGIDEKKVEVLYWAIKEIFAMHELFGCGVFDAATSCFRQVLHYEPLQYKTMSSLGLDVSYLDAIAGMKGRDSSVSLNIIPTISAICLSEAGRDLVKSKGAVHFIADTFTDARALCALPPSHAIGRSLEEMIRHHETMLTDVVEMLVFAVDVVRKIAHTGEIEVMNNGRAVDLPRFISVAVSRLTELLIPVCEANKAAAKAFIEQGGLQMFIDLAQPKLCVACFSCTHAGHSVVSLLRALILLEDQREYALEVTLSNLRASLDDVNRIFLELEKEDGYDDEFCLSTWQKKAFKAKFDELIAAISKSTIIMSGFAFRRAVVTEHKGHALFIDANLCVLPDLQRSLGKVINLLTVSDDWRLKADMDSAPEGIVYEHEDEIELRRDALNLFFRAFCTFYNNIGRLGENAKVVWSASNGYAASDHEDARKVIGLLSASAAVGVLGDVVRRSGVYGDKGGAKLERHVVRACRLVTAVLFDHRKKALFSCSVNAFVRYGGLDLLLKLTSGVACKCLEVSGAGGNTFTPTVKEIKEQERSLEITGIGRTPLVKDLEHPEWARRSVIISSQHAFLSILGILEIITARDAYRKDSEAFMSPGLYELPYWTETAADSLQKELVHSICRHAGACLQSLGLGTAWSRCPLALAKYLKCLSNCQKEGSEYLTRFWSMDASPVQVEQLNERLEKIRDKAFAHNFNEGVNLQLVIDKFPDCKASIILDAYSRPRMEERLKLREKNRSVAAASQKTGKAGSLWIWDDKSMKSKSFSMTTFGVVTPLTRRKSNLKPAKVMIEPSSALAHVLLSVDGPSVGGPGFIGKLLVYQTTNFSKSMLKSSLGDLLVLVGALPSNAHDVADTLVECYGQDKTLCASLVSKFEAQISESTSRIDSMSSSDLERWASEGKDDVLGPLMHLLAAVLNVSHMYRRRFSSSVLTHVLKLLDCWKLGCIAVKKSKAGNTLKVPKWVDASLLSLALVCEEKFKPDKHALEKESDPNSEAPPLDSFMSKIRDMLPPVDNGDVGLFVSASTHAIDCLKMSLKYADHGWDPSKRGDDGDRDGDYDRTGHFYDPCPRSSVAASLELLATTSKIRKAAGAILNGRGHNLVLSLNEPLHTADCDGMVAKIIRHLVEDEEALQASMEATIRSGMQKKRRGPHTAEATHGFKTFSVKQFVSSFLHLACRDSVIFSRAVEKTCEFSKEGSSIRVDCKPPVPTGGDEELAGANAIGGTDAAGRSTDPGPSSAIAGGPTSPGEPAADTPTADGARGAQPGKPGQSAVCSNKQSPVPKKNHKEPKSSQKSSPKKGAKKMPSPVASVMDAIIGRLLQTSTPAFAQKMTEMIKKHSVNETAVSDPKYTTTHRAELYCICQQTLCINLLSTLLASFPHCVTAFLRRDSDPLQEWIMSKHYGKQPAKAALQTPQAKGVGVGGVGEDGRSATASKKSKAKDSQESKDLGVLSPVGTGSQPALTPSSAPAGSAKSKALDMCFLIHSIIRNQVSYHGTPRNVSMRQSLSKDACSLLITLSQRSKEGQARVCRELGCILRSFAYFPQLSAAANGDGSSSQGSVIRSLEKDDTRSISADLEGSLVLLATMLSVTAVPGILSEDGSYQKGKEMIEFLLSSGFIEVLVDVIACMDLTDTTNDRTKVCLSAIIRSLEKLTSVRATDKPDNDQRSSGDLATNFEELIAHLNERGWHLAGDSGDLEHDTDESGESGSDDEGMDTHSSDSDLSENPSYLTDTSYSSFSDHGEFDMGESGDESMGIDDSDEVNGPGFSSDYSASSGHMSGSMDGESDEDMMDHDSDDSDIDHDDEDDDDEDDAARDYDFDYQLDDIFPPEETEFDVPDYAQQDIDDWRNGNGRPNEDMMVLGDQGDSDEDGFLDGNDTVEDYYSDEEYDDDSASAPYGDDRLVVGHALANTPVPTFWVQSDGERAAHWRDADPLFGTAFISPRLLMTHIGLFRRPRDTDARLPASSHSHPLVTRSYGSGSIPDSGYPSISRMDDAIGAFRWPIPPMPTPITSMGPLSVGFRAPPLGHPRAGTRLPDRLVERFASALHESMSGRPADAANRRRDRPHRFNGEWGPEADRATSPTAARPRRRQRTDPVSDDEPRSMAEIYDRLYPTRATETAGAYGRAVGAALPHWAAPDVARADAEADEDEGLDPIDPEFLAALPPDLQREVLENREREVRARQMVRADLRRVETEAMPYLRESALMPEESPGDDLPVGGQDIAFDMTADVPETATAPAGLVGDGDPGASSPARLPPTAASDPTVAITHELEGGNLRPRIPPVFRFQPSALRTNVQADIQDALREEGILSLDRDFLQDLDILRSTPRDGGGVGSHVARFFERHRMMRSGELHGIPGDIPRDLMNIARHPFRDAPDRLVDIQNDRKPLLQENQIPHLIKLLRFSRWEGRLHLNRAIRHLTESKATAAQVFEQLFAVLRCPMSSVEAYPDSLMETLTRLNHPMPGLLTSMHNYVVAPRGATTVVHALVLDPQDEDSDEEKGVLATAVVRRLLELLRHCFNLVKRGVDVILALEEVGSLYSTYARMNLVSSMPIPDMIEDRGIPALDVLLSLPLRHGISKGNLRGGSLELVCKFLTHFEKTEVEIRDKEQRIKEKKMRAMKTNANTNDEQFPSTTRLEIEKLEKERNALVEKAEPIRALFKQVDHGIIRNYVMMLTYPSLKESETDSVRMILQSLTMMNIEHWETLCNAASESVQILSTEARADLEEISRGSVPGKVWKADAKGLGVYRCLQAVAEGVFQLVVDRFDPTVPSLPDFANAAREITAHALSEMLYLTKDSLWSPFNAAASAIEELLKKEDMTRRATLPLPVQLIRPYVESYFLLHDTLRCSTCSLEVLGREISELTEEEEAWTNKREEIARAAEEQATTSFTRIQSIDFNLLQRSAESCSPEKVPNSQAPCLPSSDSDFIRFAENHRRLVNLIASHAPNVLEESMNMLLKHPKLLDFDNKRVHFRKRVQSLARQLSHHARLELNVRRPHAFEDSFNQLRVVSKSQLRSPLKVKFAGEEGVDAGGVSREWYQVMSREMFNPGISLFEAVPQGSSTYQPNPNSIVQTDEARGISHLDYFKFVGHVVGKALLDDQVIDAHFTRSFYKHMLGQPLTYRDIEGVDPDFFKNLTWMLENDIDGVLDLTFSEENDFFGQKSVIELCPNGANIKVTDENKRDYVDAIARHRMTSAIQPQIHAFLEGFWNVLPRVSLQLFSDQELELMISGLPDVDVLDLRANCEYRGGYSATSQVVLWFWEILISMDREQRALLLQFVTGTSKVPVGGFGELQAISGRQKFQIHKAFGDTNRLPTAHTCFNQLDLPEYNTKEQLRERLFLAMHEGAEGFGFA